MLANRVEPMSLTSTICLYSSRNVAERMISSGFSSYPFVNDIALAATFGGFQQPLRARVFAQQAEDLRIVAFEGFDRCRIENAPPCRSFSSS